MPYEILLQHVSIVPCLCVFGISHFGLYYLYSSTRYIVNEYVKSILSELGDLQVRVSSDKNHLGVTMHFNPVNAASGEYDRMEIFNQAMKSYFQ